MIAFLRTTLVVLLLPAALPAGPSRLKPAAVVGVGVVGPNQYDEGRPRGVLAVSVDGFWRPHPSWTVGGVGLALRASNGLYQDVSEIGLALPLVTHRRGRLVLQTGAMVQRANLQKHAFWLGVGIGTRR